MFIRAAGIAVGIACYLFARSHLLKYPTPVRLRTKRRKTLFERIQTPSLN